MKLNAHAVEKPWGRTELGSVFGGSSSRPIGEIWFEHPLAKDLPLLVKYIFTSERLSIQVHPNDEEAQARGLPRGKNECWYILDAEPQATIGLGLKSAVSAESLRTAALDGSIEDLMDWKPVAPGDFFYVPAGTVHAIGAGVTVLEVQQNSDITYRLYDYGRPREIHLDDGVAVSKFDAYEAWNARPSGGPIDTVLVKGPDFSLVRASSVDYVPPSLRDRYRWVMPLEGLAMSNGTAVSAGECLLLGPGDQLSNENQGTFLIAAPGSIESYGA